MTHFIGLCLVIFGVATLNIVIFLLGLALVYMASD